MDREALAAVLASVDPDVLAVQELAPLAEATITTHFGHHRLEPGPGNTGSGIATRFAAGFERFPFGPGARWSARLNPSSWPGLDHPFEVIGVHFANPIAWPMWRSAATRRRQLQALTALLGDATIPRAVVGDFNASPLWPVYRRLVHLMTDAAVATNSDERTWGLGGFGPRLLRIDHVFVEGTRPVRTATAEIRGSDHLGVMADLDLG